MTTENRKKALKFIFLQSLVKPVYCILALYNKTLRFRFENEQVFLERLRRGPVILAGWHQRLFCGFFLPRRYDLTIPIMISRSRDGDFISGVVQHSGFLPVRGSSSRGGRKALGEMVEVVLKHGAGAHVLDGPTGPPREVKAGLLAMAQRTGASICPVYLVCEKYWTFNSWDRFMVPKPFSRVLIRFSAEMEEVPASLDGPDFEACRKRIEDRMTDTYERLDRYFEKGERS
ncbi:MAG: lysophospholipid acyltransferase family protein [Deltaproteobacteria bacterium]|jgi:lysophospholipid acyltransferase (LPLAT)-like uncharacterized protein|nr:lysophospholipid acyltransferase family protein [Deltaproteobacteria bacterium]